MINELKLQTFMGQMLSDLGGAMSVSMFDSLHDVGDPNGQIAGFRQVRRATETPFNMVLEARP